MKTIIEFSWDYLVFVKLEHHSYNQICWIVYYIIINLLLMFFIHS